MTDITHVRGRGQHPLRMATTFLALLLLTLTFGGVAKAAPPEGVADGSMLPVLECTVPVYMSAEAIERWSRSYRLVFVQP